MPRRVNNNNYCTCSSGRALALGNETIFLEDVVVGENAQVTWRILLAR